MVNRPHSRDFLAAGYKAGIVLAFVGIVASAAYLFVYQWQASLTPAPRTAIELLAISVERRLLFLSVGIFVAMSFGFLGFALVLVQARGELDMDASVGDYKLKIARLSPGLFVILCATVILIVCATFKIEYQLGSPAADPGGVALDLESTPGTGPHVERPMLRRVPPSTDARASEPR